MLIQHIVDGNRDSAVFFVDDFYGKLDLVNEEIEFLIFLFRNKGLHIFAKRNGIPELIVTSLIQLDF